MRVTEQSRLAANVGYLNQVSAKLDELQGQLSTGKRITRASDDPAGSAISLGHRQDIAFETQMRRNLSSGSAFLNATDSALASAGDVLQRVRELTVEASNDTMGSTERTAVAAEVNQLIGHLAQVGNTNFGGAYIFAGHKSDQPAYTTTGSPPTAVTFQGDTGARVRRISKQDAVPVNVIGGQVFGTLFQDLITLRDNLNGSQPGSVIAGSLQQIDAGIDRVLQARADVGARVNRFESATAVSETTDTDLQKLRADIEDIDLPSTVVAFQAQQNAYEAALGTIGRTANMSLLNFLQ
ncbi:MAG: flagellar hook-associated protein FlgL [Dehalococcoidia bacterium]